MKLRLINFRCYSDKTFDLGNNGLSLVSGSSGVGKSTIFMAIYFALYGTGTKIVSHGKTSCSVEMEFNDMKIVRSRRPNRVVVNDTYEDEIAQNMINAKFGDCFSVTGYIAQNAIGSFILMSPIEKLEFLEKFAFKDVNLGKLKGKCKTFIGKKYEALITIISQLEMVQKILDEHEKPNDEIKFPLKCSRVLYEKATKDQEIRLKNANIHAKKYIKHIKILNQELNALNVLTATTNARKEILESQREKLNSLKSLIISADCYSETEMFEYKNRLRAMIANRKFSSLKKSFNDDVKRLECMRQNEINRLTLDIFQIESELWNEYTRDDHEKTLTDFEKFANDFETREKLCMELKKYENISRSELEELYMKMEKLREEYDISQKMIEIIKIQRETYSCPCCQAKLHIKNGALNVFDDSFSVNTDLQGAQNEKRKKEEEMRKMERHMSELEIQIHRRDELTQLIHNIEKQYSDIPENILEIKADINFLIEYGNTQNRNEKRLLVLKDQLKNEKFSATYLSFEKNVADKRMEMCEMQISEIINETMTEDELREKITEMEIMFNRNADVLKHIAQIENEIGECQNGIESAKQEYIAKFEKIRNVDEITQEISLQEMQQTENEQLILKHQEILEQIKIFNEYDAKRKTYDEWNRKVSELRDKEQEERKKYEAALMLKEKILEAESRAILNIINSINTHAQIYLDCFFPDNSMSISLLPFKETKKSVKPQINLIIEYKEMECELNMLSGGELSRVILAFTLALGEMFNTPFLLLDEATASLDQDLTGVVMRGIREHFFGKLVITIAHQVVTGIFDRTICL